MISFSDLRPINLSNFINKVISRIVHDRLEKFLPNLISANQASFVKGRSTTDNVLLAQEIIVDMAKAYDRVEWGLERKTTFFGG